MTAKRALKEPRLALDDFENMLFDRPEDEKWELIDGRLLKSMVGARWEHKQIVLNIAFSLNSHFRAKGKPCRAYEEAFWLKSETHGIQVFPDVIVFSGKLDPGQASIDNPIVLFEVVSKGGEERDLVVKRNAYRRLPSLASYAAVFRDHARVEHDLRGPNGWRPDAPLEQMDDMLTIPALDFEMSLADIYRDVIAADGGRP